MNRIFYTLTLGVVQTFSAALLFGLVMTLPSTAVADGFQFGFAKVDLTPATSLRLSGYASRKVPYEGVDEKVYARAIVIQHGSDDPHVIVSVETIGFPAKVTQAIIDRVKELGFTRDRVAVCTTHCHSAPHIADGLPNLFQPPLTESQNAATEAYTKSVIEKVASAIKVASSSMQPGKLAAANGTVKFARNRRVLADGIWSTFGENPDGPVDHSLPVLRITNVDGTKTLGLIYNYACHCTTFGGDYNRLNGDWAGYSQKYIEDSNPGAIALCTIGCGADANPNHDRDKALSLAKSQGKEISDVVDSLIASDKWQPIEAAPTATFGFAGLAHDRPTKQQLIEAIEDANPHTRRHAQVMLETWQRTGRLPETYPMPIQVWRFGDEFAMVFLGGEVVVDYALRIRKELAASSGLSPGQIWVSAYCNDVFGYVASERMRAEGGYEVDFSMIYYLLPGRWAQGTESVIMKRVAELFNQKKIAKPLNVDDAIGTFSIPDGFEITCAVAEPLVEDPINFAFDTKGRLWVVEMGDYPQGAPSRTGTRSEDADKKPWDGEPGGRVKILTDTNGDGDFDSATVFLEGLTFPTGVFPWRDGAIISGAPDIIYATDSDNDGQADKQEVLYSGYQEANPQHRVNGFEYGLDGWLYLSSGGTNNRDITCVKTGKKVRLSGRDVRIHPESGDAEAVSGGSQYGRCRDEFNNWFGNTNSEPLFQLVIEDRFFERNPHVKSPAAKHYLTDPILNPPVFPTSRTLDRFNDLHTLDRFSSACAPHVFRDISLGESLQTSALICEPVHNLISRIEIEYGGIAVEGHRAATEQNQEFLASTDNWFRPVRLMTGPNGGLWICDMYRHVIEHPEWIPESWQASLDLYAGSNMGRIYRVTKAGQEAGQKTHPMDDLSILDIPGLLEKIASDNGTVRDLAQQALLERKSDGKTNDDDVKTLVAICKSPDHSVRVRIQAMWATSLLNRSALSLSDFVKEPDARLVANAIRALGLDDQSINDFKSNNFKTADSRLVQFELALAAGTSDIARTTILPTVLKASQSDPWIQSAILSSSVGVAEELLTGLLASPDDHGFVVKGLIQTALSESPKERFPNLLSMILDGEPNRPANAVRLDAISISMDILRRHGIRMGGSEHSAELKAALLVSQNETEAAVELADLENSNMNLRSSAVKLLGHATSKLEESKNVLLDNLSPQVNVELQERAVQSLARLDCAAELVAKIPSSGPTIQQKIQSTLLTRTPWAKAITDGVKARSIVAENLSPATIQSLLDHKNDSIKDDAQELFGNPSESDRIALIEQYQSALDSVGDPSQGKKIFQEHCANCHLHNGVGQNVGPALSALASKDRAYILKSILQPNAAVEWKYKSYNLLTNDGRLVSGMISSESATSVEIVTADGKKTSLLLSEIEDMRSSTKSFMPEGFERSISPSQMTDLMQFVRPTR